MPVTAAAAEPRLWPSAPAMEQPRIHDFTSCARAPPGHPCAPRMRAVAVPSCTPCWPCRVRDRQTRWHGNRAQVRVRASAGGASALEARQEALVRGRPGFLAVFAVEGAWGVGLSSCAAAWAQPTLEGAHFGACPRGARDACRHGLASLLSTVVLTLEELVVERCHDLISTAALRAMGGCRSPQGGPAHGPPWPPMLDTVMPSDEDIRHPSVSNNSSSSTMQCIKNNINNNCNNDIYNSVNIIIMMMMIQKDVVFRTLSCCLFPGTKGLSACAVPRAQVLSLKGIRSVLDMGDFEGDRGAAAAGGAGAGLATSRPSRRPARRRSSGACPSSPRACCTWST